MLFALHVHLHLGQHLHHRFSGPHVDYVGVGVAAAVSWLGVTGVGEAALIAAAIAAAHHKLDISSMIFVAWFGAMAGGAAGWLIGLKGGRALMTRPGPLYRLRLRLLRHGDAIYERRGLLAVFFAPSLMAGISHMRFGRFLAANAASALVWALLVGLGAYFAGPSIADLVADIGTIGLIALGSAAVLSIVVRRRLRRRPAP
jgi:membrane protein DedA with SNARE-associated domain